jgi:hypothetical protein
VDAIPRGPRDRHLPFALTPAEEPVVRRAVEAYRRAKAKDRKGQFTGMTADQIIEELRPTPVRWAELASFVIDVVEGARIPR